MNNQVSLEKDWAWDETTASTDTLTVALRDPEIKLTQVCIPDPWKLILNLCCFNLLSLLIENEYPNYHTIALISHASKVMLKIFQARLQQYVIRELPDVQAGFRKGRGTRDQIATICWIIKKQESSRKTSISALLTMPKPLTVWITINCGKFWRRWEYKTTWPDSWETCMQVRKQQLELDMEQQTGSK